MKIGAQNLKKIQKIFKQYPIDAGYLFGSYAAKNANKKSDVDIAVLLSKNITLKERYRIRFELSAKLPIILKRDVDFVILNDISSIFFKYVIIKEGKLIYEKSESERVDFESKIYSLYFDFEPFLDLYNKNYVKNNS